jgi:DNA topoisomerase-2
MIDGLKISLRKILYSAFKRKLTSEIKVAQFSGYVSEHSSYHHGEASLNGAIVNMAQTYVGSNNINLLMPNGQFGTRLHGGDDSASERYIFTQLNPITRYIYPDLDDNILNYLNDDGTMVEPDYYVPIIPFALINGISGIGTGFSCNITPFNPKDIILYLKNKLNNISKKNMTFLPYYQGFKGSIHTIEDNDKKYLIKGVYEKVDNDTIKITELPVGTWTMPYTSFLETLMDGHTDKNGKRVPPSIRDFSSLSTEVNVMFSVTFPRGKLSQYESTIDPSGINGVEKLLKLTTTVSNTNIHMFNSEGKLRKYNNVPEIIDDYYDIRLKVYLKRKLAMIKSYENKLIKLSNRARYILETLDNKIDLRRKSNAVVNTMLEEKGFDKIDDNYKYLIKMPMDSVTTENVEQIVKEKADTEKELNILKSTSLEKMWHDELKSFEKEYDKYKTYREKLQTVEQDKIKSPKKVTKAKPKAKK